MLQVPWDWQVGGGGWREQSLLCPTHPGQDSTNPGPKISVLFCLKGRHLLSVLLRGWNGLI